MNEVKTALIMAAVFLAIFMTGEGVRRKWPARREAARKTVHFLGGISALTFPFLFQSHWTVLALALGFGLIILLSRAAGLLKSVHDVGRKSEGAVYFPIAVYVIFVLARGNPALYVIPLLVLTVSDTLAALLGRAYGSITYDVEGNTKSMEGSSAFLLATFLCVHLPLLLMTDIGRLESVLLALIVSLLVTGFEAVSLSGADNLFIPFGTYYILMKLTVKSLAVIEEQTFNLFIVIIVVSLLALPMRVLKTSAVIGLILLDYAAWSLCDIYWLIPLIVAQMFYLLLILSLDRRGVLDEMPDFQIRAVLFTGIIPVLLIFLANTANDYPLVFVPYLTAVTAQMAIIAATHFRIFQGRKVPSGWPPRILESLVWTIITTTLLVIFPLWQYPVSRRWPALGLIVVSSLGAQLLHHYFYDPSRPRRWGYHFSEARSRMVSTGLATLITLGSQIALP